MKLHKSSNSEREGRSEIQLTHPCQLFIHVYRFTGKKRKLHTTHTHRRGEHSHLHNEESCITSVQSNASKDLPIENTYKACLVIRKAGNGKGKYVVVMMVWTLNLNRDIKQVAVHASVQHQQSCKTQKTAMILHDPI
jgi:hypothetical protein